MRYVGDFLIIMRKKEAFIMNRILTKAIVVGGVLVTLIAILLIFGGGQRYKSLSVEEAMKIMDSGGNYQIVDVRTLTEYEGGHIPNAINVPLDQIQEGHTDALPDKNQLLLIYCYAGRRSVEAAKALASMGYVNAYEFGGIVDWTGDIVKD